MPTFGSDPEQKMLLGVYPTSNIGQSPAQFFPCGDSSQQGRPEIGLGHPHVGSNLCVSLVAEDRCFLYADSRRRFRKSGGIGAKGKATGNSRRQDRKAPSTEAEAAKKPDSTSDEYLGRRYPYSTARPYARNDPMTTSTWWPRFTARVGFAKAIQ